MKTTTFPDERLELIFTCCHPALAVEAQVALTLRALGGLTTHEIARAFLVPEPTIAQRIVRAKRTLTEARVPFEAAIEDQVNCIGCADEGEAAGKNGDAHFGSFFHGRYFWFGFSVDWIVRQAKGRERLYCATGAVRNLCYSGQITNSY